MTNPHNQPHPEELLDAYALDALEEAETLQVESHLEDCDRCSLTVAQLHIAVSQLGQSVVQAQPSPALRFRLMDALEPAVVRTEAAVSRPIWRVSRAPVVRFLLPAAAAVVVALFALGVFMNLDLSNRTEDLEQENATLAAQVALSTEQDSQLEETVQQLQLSNYWLANPENQSLSLKPPSGTGSSRGILMVTKDGRRAMLLLTGMSERPLSSIYHVWLMRDGDKVWAAKLQADEQGWGTVAIQPSEPVFRFDKVELTAERVSGSDSSLSDMVLEGAIAAPDPSRMYVLQQPPWQ